MNKRCRAGRRAVLDGDLRRISILGGRPNPSAPLNGADPWRLRAAPRSPHASILVSGDGRVNYALVDKPKRRSMSALHPGFREGGNRLSPYLRQPLAAR